MPKVITLSQFCRCEVCGCTRAAKQIRRWNDRSVCTQCIEDVLLAECP
ncbi:hypothetical protein [Paenibacillus sp. NFR01]|nr:hypothetical protein [Paenibacillus sp. NFR01]